MRVRGATLGDRDAVCKICLETGDAGDDATADYPVDPQALGKRWAVPYLELEPEFAFVIEDEGGAVCGYAFGALDTAKFAARLQAEYLPKLRAAHADPAASGAPESEWTSEQRIYHEQLGRWLSHLSEQEQHVLRLRFGLEGNERHTLAEIGRLMDVSRERVRQVELKALRKLRNLTRRLPSGI